MIRITQSVARQAPREGAQRSALHHLLCIRPRSSVLGISPPDMLHFVYDEERQAIAETDRLFDAKILAMAAAHTMMYGFVSF